MDINYCRRCGKPLHHVRDHVYKCDSNHTIYANSSPAVAAIIINDNNEVLTIRRAINPGKGELDFPGGFCDDHEDAETALKRELIEEVGLEPHQYSPMEFVCTGIDTYDFQSEILPVLSVIFTMKLTSQDTKINTADDATDACFTPLHDIDPNSIYFSSLQKAVKILQERA